MERRNLLWAMVGFVTFGRVSPRPIQRAKHPGAPGPPYCCYLDCQKDAEFSVHGVPGHFEDVTEACADHVGALIGTPTWREAENESWAVYPI